MTLSDKITAQLPYCDETSAYVFDFCHGLSVLFCRHAEAFATQSKFLISSADLEHASLQVFDGAEAILTR
jgi:hypothetical protein